MKPFSSLPKSFPTLKFASKIFLLITLFATSLNAQAQVSLNNLLPYSQNFDSLGTATTWTDNATLKGWYITSANNTSITKATGSTAFTGLASYGTTTTAADRALGHSNLASYFSLRLKNNTSTTITGFSIQYTVEVYKRSNGNNTVTTTFDYQQGQTWATATNSNATWASGGGGSSAQDGNLAANQASHSFTFPVTVAPGQEIMLRWQHSNLANFGYGLDDVTVTPVTGSTNVFFNTLNALGNTNDITLPANWNTNANGSGLAATNFSNGTFIFSSGSQAYTLPANLALGATAKLIVANGLLVIPVNNALTGTVDVNNNAGLSIQNSTVPTLGTLGELSTVTLAGSNTSLPDLSFGKLVINTNKVLSGNTTVKSSLTLGSNATLALGNFDLTLTPNASITGGSTSSYIITNGMGSLKAEIKNNNSDVVFPVGTSKKYSPIKIKQAITATSDLFSVRVLDSVYAAYQNNSPVSKALKKHAFNQTWIIDEEIKGGSDVTVSLEVSTGLILGLLDVVGGLTGFDVNQAKIVHYENNQWDYAVNLPTNLQAVTGGYTLSRSGITSFSPFSMMSGEPQALPVELLSFQAKREGNTIVSQWKTASEMNNDYFTLERSTNGRDFTALGTVKGKGTTSSASAYSFTDRSPLSTISYYRLRQTDFDGTTSVSKIVTVAPSAKTGVAFTLYPNPTAGALVVQSAGYTAEPVIIHVLNTQGLLVFEQTVSANELANGFRVNLKTQAAGLYLIKIISAKNTTTLRVVKN